MSQDNNNTNFSGNDDSLIEVDSIENEKVENNNIQQVNGMQLNEGIEQHGSIVQPSDIQQFEKNIQSINGFSQQGQNSGFQQNTENIQQTGGFAQYDNNGHPNGGYRQFANNGQPNHQNYQNNQKNFDNNDMNAGNTPQAKKKFYKNPTNWVIFFTVILGAVFFVKFVGANTDFDGDGLTRMEEVETYKTNPREADTDGDGFNDLVEIDLGTDPTVKAISMSAGTWTVGEDIEAGTYNIMCLEDEKGDITVNAAGGEDKEVHEMGNGLLRDGTSIQVELEDGHTIEVEESLSVVYFEIVE